jgi:hypothetical protein
MEAICICGYLFDLGRGEALSLEGSSGSRTSGEQRAASQSPDVKRPPP